jgi:hypothetical protein
MTKIPADGDHSDKMSRTDWLIVASLVGLVLFIQYVLFPSVEWFRWVSPVIYVVLVTIIVMVRAAFRRHNE